MVSLANPYVGKPMANEIKIYFRACGLSVCFVCLSVCPLHFVSQLVSPFKYLFFFKETSPITPIRASNMSLKFSEMVGIE